MQEPIDFHVYMVDPDGITVPVTVSAYVHTWGEIDAWFEPMAYDTSMQPGGMSFRTREAFFRYIANAVSVRL